VKEKGNCVLYNLTERRRKLKRQQHPYLLSNESDGAGLYSSLGLLTHTHIYIYTVQVILSAGLRYEPCHQKLTLFLVVVVLAPPIRIVLYAV
jgi:hypothetical protein